MTPFDFDELTVRRGTGSLKWDTVDDPEIIPLWVADMDFQTAPAVTTALAEKVASGIFGYVDVPQDYYRALSSWFLRRHGWRINSNHVIPTTGVVPAVSAIIKAFTRPGDGVILQTPAYNCFFSSIRNNGCREFDNPLIPLRKQDKLTYAIDFENLEHLASDPRNKVLILCNPHNPTGRVWNRQELEKVRDICAANSVKVVSDEIHCELVHPGFEYIPYGSVDPSAVVCCSPSKAFNTAGLQIANIVSPVDADRYAIDRAINDNEVCDVNPFGVVGLIAAYDNGENWLCCLKAYLEENRKLVEETVEQQIPSWRLCDSESTYLSWIDVSPSGLSGDEMEEFLLKNAKVRVSSGSVYGAPGFIRLNYATQRSRLSEALDRIVNALKEQM